MTTENSRADALTYDQSYEDWFHDALSKGFVSAKSGKDMQRAWRAAFAASQPAAAPIDVALPYENALHELIRKIMPGLDSGDILADAQTAINAFAGREMTDAQIDATWANLDARGSSLCEPHQWEVEMRRRFARAIIARTPAPSPADERAAFDYDDVVSICDAHGICLPVDCVEMVVEIVKLSGLLAARAASADEQGSSK